MMAFVDRIVVPGLWFLGEWSLRWGVVIAALAAWLALRPPRRAATRHLLCVVALVAGVLLPASPRWGVRLMPRPRPQAKTAAPEVSDAHTDPIPVARSDVPAPDGDRRGPASRAVARGMAAPPSPAFGPGLAAALALAAAWAAITAVMLVRLIAGQILLDRLRRGAVISDGSRQLLESCREALNLSRPVRLATHAAVASPVTLGGLRPAVLVPPDWDNWPEPDRRACLLHELAHLAHRDDCAKLVQELVRAPFFFHPLVRWLVARLDREREMLCDEAVVARGAEPVAYARLILDLARRPGRLLPAAATSRPGWLHSWTAAP